MSAAAKTSDTQIREAAGRLLEQHGAEQLSMQAVADEVKVKAPSLYKRFESRSSLLDAVTEDALAELKHCVEKAVRRGDYRQNLERMATSYRTFARRNPNAYALIFTNVPIDDKQLHNRAAAAAKLLEILSGAIGKEKALPGARLLVAFLHGFVTMELASAFRFGGDVNEAFRFGLKTILDGLFQGSGRGAPPIERE